MPLCKLLQLRWLLQATVPLGRFTIRIIQSLAYTINADAELITLFDQFRKKRNISGYDCAGMISNQEANEMRNLAVHLQEKVIKWLNDNYPDLI